ncbi:hypothetical protein DLJ53_17465 [Acuticoccus sediminis]|uniref:Uncharacterized protein n=1 Tax=Acuticoccus sediminis TaxID=2184697 RepID=A0A8B2NQR0_9HYPH|nr:hypothetical protein [Acuticoccus sediminis]RAI01012.1 hypothetical protein DLJ53_17465 [Acuticoccus sediminis]
MGVREEVLAAVVAVYADAEAQGLDGWKACETAFPGIPTDVIVNAMIEVTNRQTEAWWSQVERTIDVKVLHRAITAAGSETDEDEDDDGTDDEVETISVSNVRCVGALLNGRLVDPAEHDKWMSDRLAKRGGK